MRVAEVMIQQIDSAFSDDAIWKAAGCPRWVDGIRILVRRIQQLTDVTWHLGTKAEDLEESAHADCETARRIEQGLQMQIAILKESERSLNNQLWRQELALMELKTENRLKTAELEKLRAAGLMRPA